MFMYYILYSHTKDVGRLTSSGPTGRFARLTKLTKLTKLKECTKIIKEFLQNIGVSLQEFEFLLRVLVPPAPCLNNSNREPY